PVRMRFGVSIFRLLLQLLLMVLIRDTPKVAKDLPVAFVAWLRHQVYCEGSIPPASPVALVGSSGTRYCSPSKAGLVAVVVPAATVPFAANRRVSNSVIIACWTLSILAFIRLMI